MILPVYQQARLILIDACLPNIGYNWFIDDKFQKARYKYHISISCFFFKTSVAEPCNQLHRAQGQLGKLIIAQKE